MSGRPSQYVGWCPSGSSPQVTQPSNTLRSTGYVASQPPEPGDFNWLVYMLDQWVQYLDGVAATNNAVNSIFNSMRLLNGGFYSWNASTTTLSWTSAFNLTMPGVADSVNQVAAGSAVIPAGSVAYVNANIPFNTTGNVSSGNNTILNLLEPAGVSIGQTVQGTGIPNGTTITAVSGTSATMSANATASATGETLTFTSSAALSVLVASEATFIPQANSVFVARSTGTECFIGVGTSQMKLRDNEVRGFLNNGYVTTLEATAGVNLTQGQAVYVSVGAADGGRTAGSLYPVDASAANGATRSQFAGFVMTAVTAGSTAKVALDGLFAYPSGVTPGAVYYADPNTPGNITTTVPTVTNQYSVPVGIGIDTTRIEINGASGQLSSVVTSINPWPQYAAANETQLASALANVVTNGGGVVVLTGPFSISSMYTIPIGCMIVGRKGSSIVSVSSNSAGFVLADGSEVQDVWVNSTQTAGVVFAASGNFAYMHECKVSVQASSSSKGVYVTGSLNRFNRCQFSGVLYSTSAYGIDYTGGGYDNVDDSTLYTG